MKFFFLDDDIFFNNVGVFVYAPFEPPSVINLSNAFNVMEKQTETDNKEVNRQNQNMLFPARQTMYLKSSNINCLFPAFFFCILPQKADQSIMYIPWNSEGHHP